MPSINLMHVGKGPKRGTKIKTVHILSAYCLAANNILVQTGKNGVPVNFRTRNLVFIWGSPSEHQSRTSLQLCSPQKRRVRSSRLALRRLQESAWVFPDHNCQGHDMETVTKVIISTSATCPPAKEGTPVLVSSHVGNISPSSLQSLITAVL